MKIGFIGTGVMGKSMAGHIQQAGHDLYVYNRTKSKAEPLLAKGAIWCETPAQVAQQAQVVLSIVGYPEDVESIYLGSEGVLSAAHPGLVAIDLTTSTPSLAQKLAQEAANKGVVMFDAPVSGGDVGAKKAELNLMVGGTAEKFAEIEPLLALLGNNIQYFGPAGSGQHVKMANQIMVASTLVGMAETLAYGRAAGLSLEKLLAVVGHGAAGNWSLNNYGPRILKGDLAPGFYVKHLVKDLKIALAEADKLGLDLPGTALAKSLYDRLVKLGFQDEGVQAIINLWWANR